MTEPREQAVEYLQTAAIEAIKAMRAFLDIAESLVREPATAATMAKAFVEAVRPSTLAGEDVAAEDADTEEPSGLRRIDLD